MLNRISEIGILISIQNSLLYERVNGIYRYDVAVSTLAEHFRRSRLVYAIKDFYSVHKTRTSKVGAISKAQKARSFENIPSTYL